MSYIEDIQNRRNQVRNNIAKGFGCEFVKAQDDELGEIEKAVYADTAENRRLNRVGQEYHRGRKKQNIGNDEQNNRKEGGIISGEKFSDLMVSDFDWDSDAGKKLSNYFDKHNLTDKLDNGKTQAQDFDNLPYKHRKEISKILSSKSDENSDNGKQKLDNSAKKTSTDTLKKVASSSKAPKELKNAASKELKNRGEAKGSTPLTKNMQIKVNRISYDVEDAIKRKVFGSINSDKDVDFSKVKLEQAGPYFKLSYDGKEVHYFDKNSDFTPKAVKAAISEGFKTRMPK